MLDHEAAGHTITATDKVFRIDMHECPSKGFLIQNHLEQHRDYCDHCRQCWWEMRRKSDATPPSSTGELSGDKDVRLRADWKSDSPKLDHYTRANDADDKD